MFEKIVVVDSTGLNTWGVERLKELGKEVVFYTGIPEGDCEPDRGRRLRTRLL